MKNEYTINQFIWVSPDEFFKSPEIGTYTTKDNKAYLCWQQ